MKKRSLALVAVAAISSSGAMADVYLGAGVGQGHVKVDCDGASTCDNNGTASKLYGGYQFGNGFAVEAVYLNFGKANVANSSATFTAKAGGLGLGLAHTLKINDDWNLTSRIGAANIKVKIDGTIVGLGNASVDESNTRAYFGLALGYSLAKATRLELSADFSKAKLGAESASVRALSVGVRQSF
jgi:OOP family OmpA-OmpF porin